MDEERRKQELKGLKITLKSIQESKTLNKNSACVKLTIERLQKMIKDRTK